MPKKAQKRQNSRFVHVFWAYFLPQIGQRPCDAAFVLYTSLGRTGDLTSMTGETEDTMTGLCMGTMAACHTGIPTTHHHLKTDTVVGGVVVATGSQGDKTMTGTTVVIVTGTGEVTEDSDNNN